MSSKRTHRLVWHGMKMLHPSTCGSSIRWTVDVYKQYGNVNRDVNVYLTDCDRGIKWSGYGANGLQDMHDKINAAMNEMSRVLIAIRAAEEHCKTIPTGKKVKT